MSALPPPSQPVKIGPLHLWEADGCPDGLAQDYWERAQASINNEDSEEPAPSEALGTVPQADVAAEREIAERAGN